MYIQPPRCLTCLTWLAVATDTLVPDLDNFEQAAGTTVALHMSYNSWLLPFDLGKANAVRQRLMTPVITWEPWDPSLGILQPTYALSQIIAGAHDVYIDTWALAAKNWDHPLFLRFAHEMNGNWYPWSEAVNGNAPGEYADAWRYVRDRFDALDVQNVTWIWAPNVEYTGSTPLQGLYPGDRYVDWIGVDGYNFGNTATSSWETFEEVFGATLSTLGEHCKPLMITETACVEDPALPEAKATWIADFFAQLAARPSIRGFVWFNYIKNGNDWRVQSSRPSRDAFTTGLRTFPRAMAPLRRSDVA